MQLRLARRRQASRRQVRVQIAQQQRALEERQARRPHRSRAPEARKNQLGKQRLDQKKKECPEKNGRPQKQSVGRGKATGDSGSRGRNLGSPLCALCSRLCALCVNSFSSSPPRSGNSKAARRWTSHRAARFVESCLERGGRESLCRDLLVFFGLRFPGGQLLR